MKTKIINFNKSKEVNHILNENGLEHEEVFDSYSEEIFAICKNLFEKGLDVSVIKKQDSNVIVRVAISGFNLSVLRKQDPKRGVKTGKMKKIGKSASCQNFHKEGESYTPEQVLPYIRQREFNDKKENCKVEFNGDKINMTSIRLQTFKEKGCKCVSCGLEGTVFLKDRQSIDLPWHFNLYGWRDGELVLFTKDHIVPQSKGGSNNLSNMQTMCIDCNNEKGNRIE